MTAPGVTFEFEEPQPVVASHLLRCACCVCGGEALAAPGQTQNASCAPCAGRGQLGGVRLGSYTPGRQIAPLRAAEPVIERLEIVPPEFVCESNGCEHMEPAPVTALLDAAYGREWLAVVRHSRGGVMGGAGRQLAVAELWSVRFRRPGWMGYAVRRGAAWSSVCVAGETLPPFLALGVTELREWLEQPDRETSWYDAIRQRRAGAALAAKIVKCPGPGECPWLDERRGEHTHRGDGRLVAKTSRKEREHGG